MSNIGHAIYSAYIFKYIGCPIYSDRCELIMDRKYGCDMRGMLSFHILWLLSREALCGEDLAMELAKRRGEKPKAGTIYPALKVLKGKGLIRGEKKGKTIIYSLTPDGKKTMKFATEYFCRAFGDIFEGRKK